MSKMNILHLSHTDISSDSRILKEMKAVASHFIEHEVVGIGISDERETHKSKFGLDFNLKQIKLSSRKWTFVPDFLRHSISLVEVIFKMFFKGLKQKPKLIHCHDTLVLPVGVLIKIFTGAKLIYDAHELESNRNGLSSVSGKATLLAENILWRFINGLIVVSPSIQDWYRINIGEKKSEVIMNSPEFEEYNVDYDSDYLRNKFLIPDNERIFIYIGILGHGRGIGLLLEAFSLKKTSSHIVFMGYGSYENKIIRHAKQHSNIHFHPAVPHKDVVPIARSADVGLCLIENVSLSDYYCLPNKLFEYAFAEVPILASDFPDISKLVTDYNLGLCSALDVSSVVAAIQDFEKMEALPIIDSNGLYNLSWQAQSEKLVSFYKEIISNKI